MIPIIGAANPPAVSSFGKHVVVTGTGVSSITHQIRNASCKSEMHQLSICTVSFAAGADQQKMSLEFRAQIE